MYTNEYYMQSFTDAKRQLHLYLNELNLVRITTPPAPNKWCVAEIVSHLLQAGNLYLSVLKAGIEKGTSLKRKSSDPYHHNLFMQFFIKMVSPNNKRPLVTVKAFKPLAVDNLDKNSLLQEFDELQDAFISIVQKAEAEYIDLARVKVRNPVYPLLKMSMSACLAVTEAHQRRHFKQIEAIIS